MCSWYTSCVVMNDGAIPLFLVTICVGLKGGHVMLDWLLMQTCTIQVFN